MSRVITFGRMPTEAPKLTLTEVHFPELARLDSGTKEGYLSRVLASDGGGSRNLPRTIYAQTASAPGHDAAYAIGALHEVTLDGETGILSGKGFIVDTPEGRNAAVLIASETLFHNSVDLTEVSVDIIEHGDFWDDDFVMEARFVEWNLGATTIVGLPAFANAHAVLPNYDEIAASLETGPIVSNFTTHTIRIVQAQGPGIVQPAAEEIEVTAASAKPSWDHFHRPEPNTPHKIIVGEPDELGWIPVYGHLSLWGTCHDGIEGECIVTPRPLDNYASFNKPSVLTDRGQVEAGPIVLFGGHIPLHKAADDPANAWADVRVTPGVHGPWLSGVVRPNVALDDAKVYVARASRISGHWKTSRLKMIVCCNAEGFDVPGSGAEIAASFKTNADGEVIDLVASFPECSDEQPHDIAPGANFDQAELMKMLMSLDAVEGSREVVEQLRNLAAASPHITFTTSDTAVETTTEIEIEVELDDEDVKEFDVEVERMRRERRARLPR